MVPSLVQGRPRPCPDSVTKDLGPESVRGFGPRMIVSAPLSLRKSMTALSWNDVESKISGGSNNTFHRPYLASSESSSSSKPKLKKGWSKLSFGSWNSGSSKSSKKSAVGRRRTTNDDLVAMGGRRVTYDVRGVGICPTSLNLVKMGTPNLVQTSRFTLLTWLPKSLYWQFQRVANVYFLCIAIIVNFDWSPKDWKSKVFPFSLVLFWTALKDLYEDMGRRRDDTLENMQTTHRFNIITKAFEEIHWKDVLVGDTILVMCDEGFPADMILLRAAGGNDAFISTMTLDGENNLKERRAPIICDWFCLETPTPQHLAPDDKPSVPEICHDHSERSDSQKRERPTLMAAELDAVNFLHRVHVACLELQLGPPEVALSKVKATMSSEYTMEPANCTDINFLPRGCVLRNTSWILGTVVYAGDETKTRLNMVQSPGKFSNMQVYLNSCVWGLLGLLMIIVLSATSIAVAMQDKPFSFCCDKDSWIWRLCSYTITFYHIVPLSLYINFEVMKLVLGYQVNTDKQMYDAETQKGAVARTADLIEEMGQIDFVFSDKTGTLTRNEMVFARCCIKGIDPGDFRHGFASAFTSACSEPQDTTTAKAENDVPEGIDFVKRLLSSDQPSEESSKKDAFWFFSCLAVCHSVQVAGSQQENEKNANTSTPSTAGSTATSSTSKPCAHRRYSGISPDEVALVAGAASVGLEFEHRARKKGSNVSQVTVRGPQGEVLVYGVLYELEFTSYRKRMSVIVSMKDTASDRRELYCITKGADSILETLLAEPIDQKSKEALRLFSQHGLRTLLLASKKLGAEEFRSWERDYKAAQSRTDSERDRVVAEVAAQMETSLEFVGLTGVEDRLQDGVPAAIETLKNAGIRIWVLTGDKVETAVDIARSCQLFAQTTNLTYVVGALSVESALNMLQQAREAYMTDGRECGLVLDGNTLTIALADRACRLLIHELGLRSRSCLCCRLSPMQKGQLVSLVRDCSPRLITLAIGDGANDVPMLEGAHLGIGMRGKEGSQAVQVSDVAISQFRFLVPLLLCHGRRAYRRIALFLCFFLYKNVALLMGDVAWMVQNKYSGGIAYPEYLSINFNVLFTSWHILFVIGLDQDVPDNVACSHPELYLVGPERLLFNRLVFTKWMGYALLHGLCSWLVPSVWFGGTTVTKEPSIFWVGSCTSFTILVIVVTLRLVLCSESPLKAQTLVPSASTILVYAMVLLGICYSAPGKATQPQIKGIPGDMMADTRVLMSIVIAVCASLVLDVIELVVVHYVAPSPLSRVKREARA